MSAGFDKLRLEKRWLTYRLVNGKKPPCDDQGLPLSDWRTSGTDYATASAKLEGIVVPDVDPGAPPQKGLGLVNQTGLDFDACLDAEDHMLPAAAALLRDVPGYCEVSPSREGVKVFCRVEPPSWLEVNWHHGTSAPTISRKAPLYFCFTGEVFTDGDPDADGTAALFAIETVLGAPRRESAEKRQRQEMPSVVQAGSQNVELFREAARHTRDGKSEDEVFGILKALRERVPAEGPPWTDGDFRAIARSAARYKPADDPFPKTESGDGEFFAHIHQDSVRFDHRRKRWLVFDGSRWEPDPVQKLNEMSLASMRARAVAAAKLDDPKAATTGVAWARAGESTTRLAHLLVSAQSKLPSVGDEWDSNPWLLGVRNGVVDLRTGLLRQGRAEDYITMQTACPYDPDAKAPRWESFLADILQDNPELTPYLQRALGYSITGDCREEIFFLMTGGGRNGKGTVANTVHYVLGDYSCDLGFSSLEAKREESGATPDLAKLVRKRFVTASEASGARFNESRLKKMTGRDPITCRFLHENEFTYLPEFKLWLGVNHLPKVHDDSIGFWSRPHRVPFLQCYLGREDKTLKDTLKEEAPGILAWLVRGARLWIEDGLLAPGCVTRAVEERLPCQTSHGLFPQ